MPKFQVKVIATTVEVTFEDIEAEDFDSAVEKAKADFEIPYRTDDAGSFAVTVEVEED